MAKNFFQKLDILKFKKISTPSETETGIYVRVVETLGQAVTDSIFQARLTENGSEDEPAERRFAARDLLGLHSQRRPNRVDRGYASALCHP